MSFLSIILASAGLTLAMAGPDDAPCPLCTGKDKTPAIEAKAYESANWPSHNPERNLYSDNFQGKAMPLALGKEVVLSEGMTLEDTKGKVMIVDFWATWCGPCIAAVPKLADLQEKHEDDLIVVGVSGLSEDQNTVESFLAEKKEPFLQLYAGDEGLRRVQVHRDPAGPRRLNGRHHPLDGQPARSGVQVRC
jgi:thiol-disulfide isomerase/thioredoxin